MNPFSEKTPWVAARICSGRSATRSGVRAIAGITGGFLDDDSSVVRHGLMIMDSKNSHWRWLLLRMPVEGGDHFGERGRTIDEGRATVIGLRDRSNLVSKSQTTRLIRVCAGTFIVGLERRL